MPTLQLHHKSLLHDKLARLAVGLQLKHHLKQHRCIYYTCQEVHDLQSSMGSEPGMPSAAWAMPMRRGCSSPLLIMLARNFMVLQMSSAMRH